MQSQHTGLSDRATIIGNPAIPPPFRQDLTGPPITSFRNTYYDFASNLSRNRFYGPGVNNWNASLIKDQSLSDRFKLQMRFEFYNLFNRVQFNQPDNLIGTRHLWHLELASRSARRHNRSPADSVRHETVVLIDSKCSCSQIRQERVIQRASVVVAPFVFAIDIISRSVKDQSLWSFCHLGGVLRIFSTWQNRP